MRVAAVVRVTMLRYICSPVRSGDLVFVRRDCLVYGREDLDFLGDADQELIWFGIFAFLYII